MNYNELRHNQKIYSVINPSDALYFFKEVVIIEEIEDETVYFLSLFDRERDMILDYGNFDSNYFYSYDKALEYFEELYDGKQNYQLVKEYISNL